MDENTAFLEKASQLFIENGAKTLTMDDIAKEFGMSKKTLYQKYANKEALLSDVLHYKLEEVIEKLNELDATVENAIERMFCRDRQIEKAMQTNKSLLIRQLLKYYPTIFNKHMMDFSERFTEVMVHNIKRGREQGYYRDDFDANIYGKIFFQLVTSYDSSPFFNTDEIDRTHFNNEAMLFFLNAITTEKGKDYLKKVICTTKESA